MSDKTRIPGGWRHTPAVALLEGGATTADVTTDPIPTNGYDIVKLMIVIESAGDPVGVLHVGIIRDEIFQAAAIYQCAVRDPSTCTFTPGAPGITINDPAADAYLTVWVEVPCGEEVAVFYDRGSGGDANGIDVSYELWARTPGAIP